MRTAITVGITLALLGACASKPPDSGRAVSHAALEAHVRFLASDALEGRLTGSPGYRIAAEYVEAQFRQIGLAPGAGDGYLQEVPYVAALIQGEGSSLRVLRGGKWESVPWKTGFVAWPNPFKETTRAKGKAVFAGYGIEAPELGYNDYDKLDVLGKIVVVVNGAPKSFAPYPRAVHSDLFAKQQAAARHGAVGLAVMLDAYQSENWPWEAVVKNVGVVPRMHWISGDGAASNYEPRLTGRVLLSPGAARDLFNGAPISYEDVMAADKAGEALRPAQLPVTLDIRRRNTLERMTGPNVVGLLKGSDPVLADEYVVFTAHLDHLGVGAEVDGDSIYNGAYDNAMGVAVMIETARLLARSAPRRSVLFVAVGGEESGLLGSDYFAEHAPVGRGRMVANVNFDKPLFLFPLADVIAFGAELSDLGPLADAAARNEGLVLTPDPTPEETIFIRSDQYSFVRRGVPSLFLMPGNGSTDPAVDGEARVKEFRKQHYHSPSDDLRHPVDWPSVGKFVRINARIGLEAANADTPPRWNPGSFFGEKFTPASTH